MDARVAVRISLTHCLTQEKEGGITKHEKICSSFINFSFKSSLLFSPFSACPNPCDCFPWGLDPSFADVSCKGKQLTSVPGPLPVNAVKL